jgi:hypothetical protein
MVLVLNAVPMKIHFLGCERRRQPGAPGCSWVEKLFMKAKASIMVPSSVNCSFDSSPAWAEFFKSLLREDVSQVRKFYQFWVLIIDLLASMIIIFFKKKFSGRSSV